MRLVYHGFAVLAATALLAGVSQVQADTLATGHADLGIGYEDGELHLHIHKHDEITQGFEYAPEEAVLAIQKPFTVPSAKKYAFLGVPDSLVYVSPQVQDVNYFWLGLGTAEIDKNIFNGDTLSLRFNSLTGPGNLFLYNTSPFGDITVLLNSKDGIDNSDVLTLPVASHTHRTWAFDTPGTYELNFTATGILSAEFGGTTLTDTATFTFEVGPVPEPASLGLLGVGAMGLIMRKRK